jgi:A/G-specific adenine glycosylase
MPSDLQALMALPGIGIYSARAILCLSAGVSVPMIDEGSGRALRRVLGLHTHRPAYSDRILLKTMESILPKKTTKEFNLGLIDIVAAYCRPSNPLCSQCPLARHCTYANEAAKV